jgi:hypothetical protein
MKKENLNNKLDVLKINLFTLIALSIACFISSASFEAKAGECIVIPGFPGCFAEGSAIFGGGDDEDDGMGSAGIESIEIDWNAKDYSIFNSFLSDEQLAQKGTQVCKRRKTYFWKGKEEKILYHSFVDFRRTQNYRLVEFSCEGIIEVLVQD